MNQDVDVPQFSVGQFDSCEDFELRMNECLDERSPLASLEGDTHLVQCDDCQTLFNVYQQVTDGAAVLNGGARSLVATAMRDSDRFDHPKLWAKVTPVLLVAAAAVMFIFVLPAIQQSQSGDDFATATSPPNTMVANLTDAGGSTDSVNSTEAVFDFRSGVLDLADWHNDTYDDAWHNKAFSEVLSAIDSSQQPTFDQLFEMSEFSRRLLVQQLSQPVGKWDNPWQYTAELPGIAPLHRSVNVALVLYNDTTKLL